VRSVQKKLLSSPMSINIIQQSATFVDETKVFFQIMCLKDSFQIWIGLKDAKFGSLVLSQPSRVKHFCLKKLLISMKTIYFELM